MSVLPTSPRLRYQVLTEGSLDRFHELVIDPHIKRYLMDGETFDRDWCRDAIAHSDTIFRDRGVGLWLVYEAGAEAASAGPIGFCGFFIFAELGPEPQLLYALREPLTGRGYATEIARTMVAYAREHSDIDPIVAGVDEPNTASLRVLEKVGFTPTGALPGPFGQTLMFEYRDA